MGSEVSPNNTHPFKLERKKKNTLVFCHNGFIEEDIHFDEKKYQIKGQTDSEKLFFSILTDLKNNENIEKAIRKNLRRYKNTAGSNIVLSSKEKAVIALRKNKFTNYYQMKIGKNKDIVIISSEQLKTLPNLVWEPLEQEDVVTLNHKTLEITINKEKKRIMEKIFSKLKKAKEYKIIRLPSEYTDLFKKSTENGN